MTARTSLLALALAALAACGSLDSVPQDAVQDCSLTVTPGVAPTDVLFVVDDSPSMANDQKRLAAALSNFITALDASPIETDLHIGVTTTSVVQWTDQQTTYTTVGTPPPPSAGLPYPAGTIVAIARDPATGAPILGKLAYESGAFVGPRILSSGQPTLVSDFQANVLVGEWGSQREEPFRAARLALEKAVPGGVNDGFLRPGARLAIVFLSDEDDCSGPSDPGITSSEGCRAAKSAGILTPVADVASFLQGQIAGEARDVVLAAIVGVSPSDPSVLSCGRQPVAGDPGCADKTCTTATDEGRRFVDLLGHFAPDHREVASICDANFDRALLGFADVIMPDTLPLEGAPADWRMLVAAIQRGAATVPCSIALAGSADVPTAGAVYTPPQEGRPATLTFQNGQDPSKNQCAIQRGDTVEVKIVCAG